MCGFTGFALFRESDAIQMAADVRAMSAQLRHRGPDDSGEWTDGAAGVALGFRRLSIIDLSPAGHQPMSSASGRYVIAYNGEVYNFEAIRKELVVAGLAPAFRGHSDTEVMLAAIESWGLEAAVRRFVGMFAFALWDRRDRTLSLVRDRLGVKPLYYGWSRGTLMFGSELKALAAHPDFDDEIERGSIALLLRHNYIPAPHTIYRCFRKLLPGTILTVGRAGDGSSPVAYWSASDVAEQGSRNPFRGTETEAIDQLEELLSDSVRLRMISDVPLGVFLSGGIDSTVVTALMQKQSSRAVKTFTIGFHESGYNEAEHAKAVALHLGTEHTELYVTPDEALAVIPRLPQLYDEPFSDSSQIPTYLVSALARQHVTVSLSGDGGDELFGGYSRYFWGRSIWRKIGWMPAAMRVAVARSLAVPTPAFWEGAFRALSPVLPRSVMQVNPGDKLAKLAEVLAVRSPDEMYRGLVSHWKNPLEVVTGTDEPSTLLNRPEEWAKLDDFTARMMFFDLVTYLPDDILVKVDRASMGVSLEAREPLLDHRLVEFAWRLPMRMRMRGEQGKWALRQVLYRHVPPALIDRPKMGFGVPIDRWLRGPLRDWAEALLDERRLKQEGYFDPAPIRTKWQEHLSGRRNWQYLLWDVLMFQAWHELAASRRH